MSYLRKIEIVTSSNLYFYRKSKLLISKILNMCLFKADTCISKKLVESPLTLILGFFKSLGPLFVKSLKIFTITFVAICCVIWNLPQDCHTLKFIKRTNANSSCLHAWMHNFVDHLGIFTPGENIFWFIKWIFVWFFLIY